jgi:hypothetical protein
LKDSTLEEKNLDARVKLYQNEHYQSLLTWKDMHGLCLDDQNYYTYERGTPLLLWKTTILGGGYFTIFTLLKPLDTLESQKPSN